MRTCTQFTCLSLATTDKNSDGATPEAKAKQILAIAPILKGQPPFQQTQAAPSQQTQPPFQQQQQSHPHPQHSQQQQQQPYQAQQQPAGHNDLIDFGQPDTNQASPIPPRNSSLQQTVHQPMDAPPGLQEPMQPGQPLRRVDTLTKDVDEFVDAPGP